MEEKQVVKKQNKKNSKQYDEYKRQEEKSLKRHQTARSSLKMTNEEIRRYLHALLKQQDKVLLSAVGAVIAENKGYDRLKTGVRIQFAIKKQDSGLKIVHDENNRRWIVKQ
jgi:hypothetical protein